MTDIREIRVGDLVFVSGKIKDVIILHQKIGRIKENQIALFLGCAFHKHRKDTFWTVELLIDGKRVMMFTPTSTTNYLLKIDIPDEAC